MGSSDLKKILFASLFFLYCGYSFADDSTFSKDLVTGFAQFFQMNIDMVQQLSNRYNFDNSPLVTPTPQILRSRNYVSFEPTMVAGGTSFVAAPVTYVFNSSSAWGDSTIKIIDKHNHFEIHGVCTGQLEKWILKKDDAEKTIIASGALNDQNSFFADIPGEFQNGLSLTLMVVTPDNQYPVLVELH